jgi:hypothetical protein
MKRAYFLAVLGTFALIVLVYFGYPRLILAKYGDDFPSTWNATLRTVPHEALIQKFGPPSVDASVKGFLHWERKHWWGRHELQLGYEECCSNVSKPRSVYVAVYVNGWYDPVSFKKLLD